MKWAKPRQIIQLIAMLKKISQGDSLMVSHYTKKGWLVKDLKGPLDEPLRFEANKLVSDLAILRAEYEAGSIDMKVLNKRFNALRPIIKKYLDAEKCIPDKFEIGKPHIVKARE